MASSSSSRSLKYNTDYSTRSQSVVDRMNDINDDFPLINITKGPEYSVTRDFTKSMQGDIDFADCLTSF